jgi:hypothetical protein
MGPWLQGEPVPPQRDFDIGRHHVHVPRLDRHAVLDLVNRHAGFSCKRFDESARMRGIQMLNQDKRHSQPRRYRAQELAKGFQATRRSPDSDDGKGGRGQIASSRTGLRRVFAAALQ